MVRELLQFLPKDLSTTAVACAAAIGVLGIALWLAGSRFHQMLVTLAGVAVGALVGLHVPGWANWRLSPWAAATAGALVLGICGYVGQRISACICLGAVLAVWATIATWLACAPGAAWSWPSADPNSAWAAYLQSFWTGLPEGVRPVLPFACGVAFVSGVGIAILWRRPALIILHSLLGLTMAVPVAIMLVERSRPQWLRSMPGETKTHLGVLLGLAILGALVQWWLTGRTGKKPAVNEAT